MEKKHLTLQDRHNIEQMLNARKSFTALRITGKPEQNEDSSLRKLYFHIPNLSPPLCIWDIATFTFPILVSLAV